VGQAGSRSRSKESGGVLSSASCVRRRLASHVLAFALFVVGCQEPATVRPNILLIVADDMGYSDVGAFGGEIGTPNIDALADQGVVLTQLHAAPNCGPTRGSMLTGVDYHRAGMGGNPEVAADNQKKDPAYQGYLRDDVVTIGELLRDAGYRTMMAGKWHLGKDARNLPGGRGFEESFALLNGAASHWADQAPIIPGSSTRYTHNDRPVDVLPDNFYSTTDYTNRTVQFIRESAAGEAPFFAYLSYTAPHNPLHAPKSSVDKYRGRYDDGWDAVAEERVGRMRELGLVGDDHTPYPRPDWILGWDDLTPEQKASRARDMEVYAGMIDYMDESIGLVLAELRNQGAYDNTLIVFLSDNGPSKTSILDYLALGGEAGEFFASFDNSLENKGAPGSSTDVGPGWAYASAVPFRLFKGYVAQGGIQVPGIVKLPTGIPQPKEAVTVPLHVFDLMPTFLEVAGATYPSSYRGIDIAPVQGSSMVSALTGQDVSQFVERGLGWEAYGMDAYRQGNWKVLRLPEPYGNGQWQLYDLDTDPGETADLATEYPDLVEKLAEGWQKYADFNGVVRPDRPVAYGRPVAAGRY
jgi:arylsulfatase A-like enzyme